MKFNLYTDVVLSVDIPETPLRKGDVATVVDHHPTSKKEDGYSLEVFTATGETLTVVTVPESAIRKLEEDEVFSVRRVKAA
jgi:hypothetical protein